MMNEDSEVRRLCEEVLQHDLAAVTVKIGSPTLVTSVRARKTTFAEQLATFGFEFIMCFVREIIFEKSLFFAGGTVGLFTGMSFLSAFEVVFWIKKGFTNLFVKK